METECCHLLLLLLTLQALQVLLAAQQASQRLAALQAELPTRQQCNCCWHPCSWVQQRQQRPQRCLVQHVESAAATAALVRRHFLQHAPHSLLQILHRLLHLLLRLSADHPPAHPAA
jgi:hypothetical protein